MGKKLTTAEFIERAAEIHSGKYDYSTTVYSTTYQKIAIGCPVHGTFIQVAKDHLNGYGCPACGGTGKKTTTEFIEKSQLVHGDKYDYTLVDLKSMNKKVKIICPDHGEFNQRPADHAVGVGCPTCSLYARGRYSDKYFEDHPGDAASPAVLYVVNVNDKFCKVGITKHDVMKRFANKNVIPVNVVHTTLYAAYALEQRLLEQYKDKRYMAVGLSSRDFAGWTECFPLSMLDELTMAVETIK